MNTMNQRKINPPADDSSNIPAKANRVLNVILVGLLLIVLKIWHLAVVQYNDKLEESRKPQRRVVVEPAKRATVRDRFNIPLALNKMQYNVAVLYSQIKQVPVAAWQPGPDGKRIKQPKRKEYVTALSQLLGHELDMDAERIEDLIYAKASFYQNLPFVIKEDITEQEYYRLKMLEKDWLGIQVQRVPRRHYPLGKVAGDIIGYMGAINRKEYEVIINESRSLEAYIEMCETGETPPLPKGMASMDDVRLRLKDLKELAYSINDSIGKTGIERHFENVLRGYQGKKSYYSDSRGNFLRELPGTREPLAGKRVLLTISSELQEYAEQLLVQNETIRQTRLSHLDAIKHTILALKQPWIKGGSIIAMDPKTGEILAMASIPRFDPNDFIFSGNEERHKHNTANVHKWLESENYLADLWNQQRPLEKEAFDKSKEVFYNEEEWITWENYLKNVLAKGSPLNLAMGETTKLENAYSLQTHVDKLLELTCPKDAYQLFSALYGGERYHSYGKKPSLLEKEALNMSLDENASEIRLHKTEIDKYLAPLAHIYDQVLMIDLIRLAMPADKFSMELIEAVGHHSLSAYHDASSAMITIDSTVKKMAKKLFHDLDFKEWRKANEKEFLKEKRATEKALQRYARPYTDYLDAHENEMFQEFWKKHKWNLIAEFLIPQSDKNTNTSINLYSDFFHSWKNEIANGAHREIEWAKAYKTLKNIVHGLPSNLAIEYLKTMRGYAELDRPLLGRYRYLRKNKDQTHTEKNLAAAFYPKLGYGYGRSQAYRQASTQGSLFKMVTAYEALIQRYQKLTAEGKSLSQLNPLEMVDSLFQKGKDVYLGYGPDGQPLPRHYKGGRLPKSTHPAGKIDLLKAIETSSNPYFALIAGDILDSPQDLALAAKKFSFGTRTGIDLPGELAGMVPEDLETNRTGLYAFSIGQHTLVVTPLQTSVMLSALANKGKILKPKIVAMTAGRDPKRGKELVAGRNYFPYQEALSYTGIDFPLFVATDAEQQKSLVQYAPTEVRNILFLPDMVHKMLLDGMCRVVARSHTESIYSLSRLYQGHPEAISDYVEMKHQLIGKTSTAESVENIDLDLNEGTNMYTHVWFGGISYEEDIMEDKNHPGTFLFKDNLAQPELVVVVYLRYGGFGKEAAPLAAQMVKKWREIKQNHNR